MVLKPCVEGVEVIREGETIHCCDLDGVSADGSDGHGSHVFKTLSEGVELFNLHRGTPV